MNKDRKKRIKAILVQLGELQTEIEQIKDEEQLAYDNLPESLQNGDKGCKMLEAIENLDSACSSFEDIPGCLEEAIV